VGFVVDKVALGQVFSEYFNFPCQSYSTVCSTVTSSGAGTVGQLVAPETKKKKLKLYLKDSSPNSKFLPKEINIPVSEHQVINT
jgi:hypothetical protein